jgi:hypothetical protein
MISIIYVVIYMLNGYKLPWPTSKDYNSKQVMTSSLIGFRKQPNIDDQLFNNLPMELRLLY